MLSNANRARRSAVLAAGVLSSAFALLPAVAQAQEPEPEPEPEPERGAYVFRENVRGPYVRGGPSACPVEGQAPVEGSRHHVYRETVVPGQEFGGLNGVHDNSQGASREDPVTGTKERIVNVNNETLNVTPGGALVYNSTDSRLDVSQGEETNDQLHSNGHLTITPDGRFVGEHYFFRSNCPPPPPPPIDDGGDGGGEGPPPDDGGGEGPL